MTHQDIPPFAQSLGEKVLPWLRRVRGPARRSVRVFSWVTPMLLGAIGAGLTFCMLYVLGMGAYSWTWPYTDDSRVHSARLKRGSSSKGGTIYTPSIEYSYSVGGLTHEANRVFFGAGNTSFARAREIVDRAGSGHVRVYYNPWMPSQSVLQPGPHWPNLIGLLLGGVFLWGARKMWRDGEHVRSGTGDAPLQGLAEALGGRFDEGVIHIVRHERKFLVRWGGFTRNPKPMDGLSILTTFQSGTRVNGFMLFVRGQLPFIGRLNLLFASRLVTGDRDFDASVRASGVSDKEALTRWLADDRVRRSLLRLVSTGCSAISVGAGALQAMQEGLQIADLDPKRISLIMDEVDALARSLENG